MLVKRIWSQFASLVFGSRHARTIGVVANSIVGGILTNWLIADLSRDGKGVDWKGVWSAEAFYVLLLFVGVFLTYTYGLYRYEKILDKWNDPKFLNGLMRQELVPVLLEGLKDRMRTGQQISLSDFEKELLQK